MMKEKCELWLVIDSDGGYEVGTDRDCAIENFENNIGNAAGARIIKITAMVTPPKPTEVEVDVADEAGETVEAAVETEETEAA